MDRIRLAAALGLAFSVAMAAGCRESAASPVDLQARVDAAEEGATITLGPGTYASSVVLRKRVTLEGAGVERTFLVATEGFTATLAATGARLSKLTVRGGEGGVVLLAGAAASLRDVRVEAGVIGVRVEAGAALAVADSRVVCAVSKRRDSVGVVVQGGGLRARGLTVAGSCLRGVDVAQGRAELVQSSIDGAVDAGIRVVDGTLELAGVQASVGRHGMAAVGVRSKVNARDLTLRGGEQGLMLKDGEAELTSVAITEASQTGVALVGATATLVRLHLTGPFLHAGVIVTETKHVTLRRLEVERAGSTGLLAVRGELVVEGARVSGARVDGDGDFGHAFTFTSSTARLSKLAIEDVEGAAVYASDSAVTVTTLAATKVGMGLAAALGATLTATDLELELPAAVGALAWGRSTVSLSDARLASDLGLVACGGSSVREGAGVVVTARPRRRACREEAMRDGWRKALTTASE